MAISLTNLYSYAYNSTASLQLVTASICVAAMAVLNEDPATVNHAARLAWASKTLDDPISMGKKMIWGVLSDPNVQAAFPTPSDTIINTSTAALVNSYLNA